MDSPIVTVYQTTCIQHLEQTVRLNKDLLTKTDLILRVTLLYEKCFWCQYEMKEDYKNKRLNRMEKQ